MGLYSGVLHIHMLRLFFIFSFDLTINIHGFFGFFKNNLQVERACLRQAFVVLINTGLKQKQSLTVQYYWTSKFPNTPFYLNDFDIKANPLLTNVTFFKKKKEHYALRQKVLPLFVKNSIHVICLPHGAPLGSIENWKGQGR